MNKIGKKIFIFVITFMLVVGYTAPMHFGINGYNVLANEEGYEEGNAFNESDNAITFVDEEKTEGSTKIEEPSLPELSEQLKPEGELIDEKKTYRLCVCYRHL